MSKRVILLSIVFLALGLGALAVFFNFPGRKTVSVPTPTPAPSYSLPVPLPSAVSSSEISYRVGALPVSPQQIPLYKVLPASQSARQIYDSVARVLRFVGEPLLVEGTRGTVLIRSDGERSLTLTPDGNTITFSYTRGLIEDNASPLPNNELLSVAKSFFSSLSFPHLPDDVSVTREFSLAEGGTGEASSSVRQFDFAYGLDGIPLYTHRFGSPPDVWVRTSPGGHVAAFSAVILPNFIKTETPLSLVSVEEATGRLQNKQGVLTSFVWQGSDNSPAYLPSPPQLVSVSSVELAYYYTPSADSLLAVYVFRGVGQVSGGPVQTTTAVSALQ